MVSFNECGQMKYPYHKWITCVFLVKCDESLCTHLSVKGYAIHMWIRNTLLPFKG